MSGNSIKIVIFARIGRFGKHVSQIDIFNSLKFELKHDEFIKKTYMYSKIVSTKNTALASLTWLGGFSCAKLYIPTC